MNIGVGTIIKVKTRTKDNIFGDVWYEIVEVTNDVENGSFKNEVNVKAVMLGGTGPSARPGMIVLDTVSQIERDIAEGRTEIVPREQKAAIVRRFAGGE